jgi:acetyl-CoA acyltransferase 2
MPLDVQSREIVILSGVRTAFGTMNGSLADLTATDLAVETAGPALEQAGVAPDQVDHVIYGNVLQTANDAIYLARHVGLRSGVPQHVPAITLNRLCGSGFQAVVSAAEQILTGQARVVLAGGAENMSMAPHVAHGLRKGAKFGRPPKLQDLLWECLTDTYSGLPMAMTAENLGARKEVSRRDADEYAALSQQRWAAAHERGVFADEIVPVTLKSRKGETVFDTDEHPRPGSTPDSLAKLPAVFKKDGLVSAGNASGIGDGAASLVVADRAWAEAQGLTPLARLVGWGVAGCDPDIMGIGPVPASERAFDQTGLSLSDMDLVEVNEAFAPQVVAVERTLGIDREKLNIYGGAIPMTHPLAASGARITATLVHALRREDKQLALGSACIGGGQGIAVILERL